MTLAHPRARRALLALGLVAALVFSLLATADASSHREAPLITEDPVADNTDLYAFVSPGDPDSTTLIANWIPFENPAGGPNFYNFGDDVLYKINIDNDGDAVPDIVYEWRFTTTIVNPETFLYATGPITVNDDGSYSDTFNLRQTYDLAVVRDGVRTTLATGLSVPPNNVGPRSTPDYDQLAQAAVHELPGGVTSFAGQRDEAFYIDLGAIFDLGGLRPFNEAHLIPLDNAPGKDATAGFNVHSIALEVPTSELVASADQPVIGVWTTTDRRQTRVFAGGSSATPNHNGQFVQVSRLGMPLVNEVVIPLALKDAFNGLEPRNDAATLAGLEIGTADEGDIPLVTDPLLVDVINTVYPGVFECQPEKPRADLVQIFLTGIPDFTAIPGGTPAEYLRLNTSIPPSSSDPNAQNRLGALSGENDGFPNGRRLNDDTVDISLRAVMGGTPFSNCGDVAPNNALGDGVDGNDKPFLQQFPYIPAPHSGYDDPNGN